MSQVPAATRALRVLRYLASQPDPATLSSLRTLLAETRQRGYATEDGEVTPGFASVAAAVLDHNGYPVAGIAITHPSDLEPPGLPDAVRRTAGALTHRLSGRE